MTTHFNYLAVRLHATHPEDENDDFHKGLDFDFPESEMELYIGRAPSNHIHLQNEAVSGRHIRILRHGGEYFLHDLGSRNGTFLNSKRLEPNSQKLLRDQDVISVVPYEIQFFLGISAYSKDTTENTTQFALSMLQKEIGGAIIEETPPHIFVLSGSAQGDFASMLGEFSEVTIGRAPHCELQLEDENISREHCIIRKERDLFFIRDLNSRNGVILNNERLVPNVDFPLYDRDEFLLGTVSYTLSNPNGEQRPATEEENVESISLIEINKPQEPHPSLNSQPSETSMQVNPESGGLEPSAYENPMLSSEQLGEVSPDALLADDNAVNEGEASRPSMKTSGGLTPGQKMTLGLLIFLLIALIATIVFLFLPKS